MKNRKTRQSSRFRRRTRKYKQRSGGANPDYKDISILTRIYQKHDVPFRTNILETDDDDDEITYRSVPISGKCSIFTTIFRINPRNKSLHLNTVSSCVMIHPDQTQTPIRGRNIIAAIIEYAKVLGLETVELSDKASIIINGCDMNINRDIGNYMKTLNSDLTFVYSFKYHVLSILELLATGKSWYGKHFGFQEKTNAYENTQTREAFAIIPAIDIIPSVLHIRDDFVIDMMPFINEANPGGIATMRDCARYLHTILIRHSTSPDNPITPYECNILSVFMQFLNAFEINDSFPYNTDQILYLT